jgi:plastocyanin
VVVVRLVERGGSVPYAFEPANVDVERGDTLRFVQSADTPHNVRFTKEPPGAKLGSATTGPYLVAKGQTYDLVIDARFTAGSYTFVCDPHEMIGMRGSMTVVNTPTAANGK